MEEKPYASSAGYLSIGTLTMKSIRILPPGRPFR